MQVDPRFLVLRQHKLDDDLFLSTPGEMSPRRYSPRSRQKAGIQKVHFGIDLPCLIVKSLVGLVGIDLVGGSVPQAFMEPLGIVEPHIGIYPRVCLRDIPVIM
jgi:hypothetical protein